MEKGREALKGFAAAGTEINPKFYQKTFYDVDDFMKIIKN